MSSANEKQVWFIAEHLVDTFGHAPGLGMTFCRDCTVRPVAAPHRVVIVGAGFAGLFAAKALRRADVEVTVIDRTNHHLFQPLLYQMATGILAEGDIAPPIRDILRGQRNATVILGEVVGIDLEARRSGGQHAWPAQRGFLRQPDHCHRRKAVVLRTPGVRPIRAGHEDD